MAGGEPGDPYHTHPGGALPGGDAALHPHSVPALMRKPVWATGHSIRAGAAAVERTAKMLEGLGHHVTRNEPDYDAAGNRRVAR